MSESTTKQERDYIPNPTGKGGFGDNPNHRSDGRWSKENSFSYWMNKFKSLSPKEFKNYKIEHKDEMTMAALGAYARVKNMSKSMIEFKEVADRTEGKPVQSVIVEDKSLKLDV